MVAERLLLTAVLPVLIEGLNATVDCVPRRVTIGRAAVDNFMLLLFFYLFLVY